MQCRTDRCIIILWFRVLQDLGGMERINLEPKCLHVGPYCQMFFPFFYIVRFYLDLGTIFLSKACEVNVDFRNLLKTKSYGLRCALWADRR